METKILTGNFALKIEGSISAEKQEDVNQSGITYIVQRDGLSAVYKALLGKGEKRDTLAYSEDAGSKISAELAKALAPYGSFTVEVAEHVPGESAAAPRAMATEMWNGSIKGNDLMRQSLGIAADATDEQGIEACHAYLAQFRKAPVRKPKAE